MIPMSESLTVYCRYYVKKMVFDMDKEGYFYPAPDGRKYNSGSILCGFRKVLREAGIISSDSTSPRVHDLRHTFSVYSFEKMVSECKDIYFVLKFIYTYMFHR